MKQVLFIDRDGTLIIEPPDEQIDTLEKLEFLPGVFKYLSLIRQTLPFELVMVSNQDGLGTEAYPQKDFDLVQQKILTAFKNEDVGFDEILIDKSTAGENLPTRKPGTAMLTGYMNGDYDLENSYVIGDRITDIELARNLGARGILIGSGNEMKLLEDKNLDKFCTLVAADWEEVYRYLRTRNRFGEVHRETGETDIHVKVALDGSGQSSVDTGLGFFNHMLDQLARHSGCDLEVKVKGDLQVDEHHTIEDTALALGEAFITALADKRGIGRYGFTLPMDDAQVTVALDFGGRNWFKWEAEFNREMIGEMPTEMFSHFFKSFSDAARCNLHIKAEGENEHHKIEAIFKAMARALRMAIKIEDEEGEIPSTKGTIA
jgi:imidazoleglycerol-phosphate dehydratase/histidinol-phosphatase